MTLSHIFAVLLQMSIVAGAHSTAVTPHDGTIRCASARDVKELLDKGSLEAAARAMRILRCYDGTQLEEVYVDLGMLFMKHPAEIFREIHAAALTKYEIQSIMTALPWDLTDKPCAQFNELVKRESALRAITGYDTERKIAISAVISAKQPFTEYCERESHGVKS